MALARTDLLGHVSPAAGGNFGTGAYAPPAVTPPANSLLVVAVACFENSGGTNPAADLAISDSGGHTWTPRFALNTTGGFASALAIYTTPIVASAATTITLTCNGRNIAMWAASVVAYAGYDTATPVGTLVSLVVSSGITAPPNPVTMTLPAAPAASSEVFAAVAADRTSAGVTPGATLTEIHDVSNPTASVGGGLETEARTGSTSTTVDWVDIRPAGGALFNYVAEAIEIRAATGGSPVTVPDPVNGAGGSAGSTDGRALGDDSRGAGTAGTLDGRVLGDASSGAGTAGTLDGLTLGDGSGGGGSSGSLDGLALGDGSGAGGTAGSTDGRVLGDDSRGAGTGGSADTITGPVMITDTSGGGGTGGSADAVSSGSLVVHDTMVMPILLNARACLVTEVGKLAYPPARVQIRPGAAFEFQADGDVNECCEGIAWVRRGTLTPTGPNWPNQLADSRKDPPPYYAVQLELGVERCIPLAADMTGANVTAEQWEQAVINSEDDGAALRRVVCCLRDLYGNDAIIENPTIPLENGGLCGGQILTVTVRAPACDCVG